MNNNNVSSSGVTTTISTFRPLLSSSAPPAIYTCTARQAGVILNLNITNVMITFELLHSHELLIQAKGRMRRR